MVRRYSVATSFAPHAPPSVFSWIVSLLLEIQVSFSSSDKTVVDYKDCCSLISSRVNSSGFLLDIITSIIFTVINL